MDGDPGSIRGSLIEKLSQKASLSQKVFDNTFSVFGRLKEVLHEMSSEIDDALEEEGKDEVKIEYRDRGKFEAQLQIAEDILIFSMHSNVFDSTASTSSGKTPMSATTGTTPTAASSTYTTFSRIRSNTTAAPTRDT